MAQSGGKLSLNGHPANTLDGVHVQGDLELAPASQLRIRNGLALTGTVLVDSGAVIAFAGDQTFDTGSVTFTGTSGFLDVDLNSTLTLGPSMVVRGKIASFRQGGGSSRLVNQGLISSDVAGGVMVISGGQFVNAGRLESKNGGSLSVLATSWTNRGRIDAVGGGTLMLEGAWNNSGTITAHDTTVHLGGSFTLANLGTFNRTGGTVNLTGLLDLNGATLTLNAATGPWSLRSGTIKNGSVTQNEGAKLDFFFRPTTPNTLDNVRVEGDLDLRDGGRVLIRNGLTLNGSALLDNFGGISFIGDQTFDAASVVFVGSSISGNSGFLGIESNSTLTLGPAMVVGGKSGTIGPSGLLGGVGKLINQGSITADGVGGALVIRPAEFENRGRLAANGANATLTVQVIPFTNTGVIEELNGGKVLINP